MMTHDEMERFLKKCRYGRLGLNFQNEPYVVPVTYGYDQGRIFFHSTNKQGKKADFIKNNNRVCFHVEVNERQKGWSCVICYGTATLREDIEAEREFYEVVRGQKPSDEQLGKMKSCIGIIQIEEMTGRYRTGAANAPVSRLRRED
jgi:nitroimidazol reductase NimA-like FMN-containing flavoprotein (pyridoxamine 5'-phosphate oxidase superfamily)